MKEDAVIRSTRVVGGLTLLSRGLGMLRDIVIAKYFGTSLAASAFFVAFTIPNLFRRLFGEGALSAAFIPVFIETRTRQGEKAAWDMASKVITMCTALLVAIALLGVLFFSVAMGFPGLSDKWVTTFALSRVMFPYVVFICLAALFMAVLNSFRHFATSAFAPSLLNIALIVSMLSLFPLAGGDDYRRAMILSVTVVVAGILQMAIQIPAMKRFGCPFRFTSRWNDPQVRKMLMLMGPTALGMGVTQFNVLIDRFLAMWIGDWAPAALFYSERLVYLPLGIIATAMGTVLLPAFSTHATEGDHAAMGRTISHSMRHLLFIMTPAALGLLVLAPDIIQAVLEWPGRFDAESTRQCARALAFYAPGLVVFSGAKVFVPAFYALQDTKTPVKIGVGAVVLNLAMNLLFIFTFPLYWKHAGMALATVLAEAAAVACLAVLLARRLEGIRWRETFRTLIRSLICSLVMAVVAWLLMHYLRTATDGHLPAKAQQFVALLSAIAGSILTYVLLSILLRAPEIGEIKDSFSTKRRKPNHG